MSPCELILPCVDKSPSVAKLPPISAEPSKSKSPGALMFPLFGSILIGVFVIAPSGAPGTGTNTGNGYGIPRGVGIATGVNTGDGFVGSVGGVDGVYQYSWLSSR